jgi:predicted amidohydrolase
MTFETGSEPPVVYPGRASRAYFPVVAKSVSIRGRLLGAALLVLGWTAGCGGDGEPDLSGRTATSDAGSQGGGPQAVFADSGVLGGDAAVADRTDDGALLPQPSGAPDATPSTHHPADAGQDADITPEPDADLGDIPDAAGQLPPDASPPATTTLRVAAVQYGSGAHDQFPDCRKDICAIEVLVREAAAAGATVIVTPEYAIYKRVAETSPEIGALPAQDRRWLASTIMHKLAELADELDVLLVFNLLTKADGNVYNTAVAIDRDGRVVARHYKFQLYGDYEQEDLTAGSGFNYSHLETEVGTIGLLICADIHCVYGTSTECNVAERKVFDAYTAIEADVVLFLAMWQAGEPSGAATRWWPLSVQQEYAQTQNVWLVAANTTVGDGRGAGIFRPGGASVTTTTGDTPSVLYADVPRR